MNNLLLKGYVGGYAVSDEAIREARLCESVALQEYKRTLQMYTAIILHGGVIEEPKT